MKNKLKNKKGRKSKEETISEISEIKEKHQPVKKNQSSIQVLKTLQVLMEDNYSMVELVERLNAKEDEPVFNNSVVSKYINTCRYCGIDIHKIHNRYFVSNIPFGMNITEREFELLENLEQTAKRSFSKKANNALTTFLNKLCHYSNKEITRVEKDTVSLTSSLFEKAVRDEKKVRLMFRAKAIMDCIPIELINHNGRLYFHVFYKNRERMIGAERVSGLEVLNEKFRTAKVYDEVVYKVMGELSQRYSLRANETVIDDSLPKSRVISNKGESKDVLLSRLMRYGELCEVIKPTYFRKEFIQELNNTLANYGE